MAKFTGEVSHKHNVMITKYTEYGHIQGCIKQIPMA